MHTPILPHPFIGPFSGLSGPMDCRYPLIPSALAALRANTDIPAPALFNRPLPGVAESQCPTCGALTSGPRAGWTPAAYDAEGYLRPARIAVPLSGMCSACRALDARLRELRALQAKRQLPTEQLRHITTYLYTIAGVSARREAAV